MKGFPGRGFGLLFFILSFFMISGCLGDRNWQYPPSSTGAYLSTKATSSIPASAIVLPLEDLRGDFAKEGYWLAAIPLVPYGETRYERPEAVENPEEVDELLFNPPQDFGQSIAKELDQSGVFSSVTFAEEEKNSQADLVFRGRLRSMDWKRRLYTYLLGPLGPVLWVLGLPMSETTTGLELDLQLAPLNNPTRVLWKMTMDFEGKQLDGPYYGLETAVESYPQALQESLKPAIADLVGIANQDPTRLLPR